MVTSTEVSQYHIIGKDINIDHQSNRIIRSNIDDSVNCAKETIKNSVDLKGCNFSADITIPSSSSCRNYKSSNGHNSSNLNNEKNHDVQENRKKQKANIKRAVILGDSTFKHLNS